MRIATRTIYELQKYQLGGLQKNLAGDNTIVSTRKRINKLSDDPVGLTQVLNFKAGYKYLEQIDNNIENGKTWLNTAETAMDSIEDLTLEMKTLALKMNNSSVNKKQRLNAVDQVNAALGEIINLGNTQIRGEYIFSGNRTDIRPIEADDLKNPEKITYNGDFEAYQIKISQVDTMAVGQVGGNIFFEDTVKIDSTNNLVDFKEQIRGGYEIGEIKIGESIKNDTVNIEVKNYNALNRGTPEFEPLQFQWDDEKKVWNVKNDPGYELPETIEGTSDAFDVDFDNDGSPDIEVRISNSAENNDYVEFSLVERNETLTAEIPPGEYNRESLAKAVENALTKTSMEDGYKIKYNADYDEVTKKYSITFDNKSHDGYIKTDFLWESGENNGRSIGPELGFDDFDASFEPAVSDYSLGSIINSGINDTLQFSVDGGFSTHTITIPPGKYTTEKLADEIETKMKKAVSDINFDKNFDVKFDNREVKFKFDASQTDLSAGSFQIYWSSGPSGLGDTLGFNTNVDDTGSLEYNGLSFAPTTFIEKGVNDSIDFSLNGTAYSVEILRGQYSNEELGREIAASMDLAAGVKGFKVDFDIDSASYMIDASGTGAASFALLWASGTHSSSSAGETLGFNPTADSTGALDYTGNSLPLGVTITAGVNDRINFKELPQEGRFSPELSITMDAGSYTGDELAAHIEFKMEQASSAEGYNIDYIVSYDSVTNQFKFRENGAVLDEIQFLWKSGSDRPVSEGGTGRSAAVTLGFDDKKDSSAVLTNTSDESASWGIYDSLIDFKKYLRNNDLEGINRTLTRLDYHYNKELSKVTEIGMKNARLITKQSVISNVSFTYEKNRSKIEDADMVGAISNLISSETAYQAALSSSARIMRLSLADYLK
ncbi:MAG: flagellar hook-associated protein 3 [Deltaproteobacteria bacterium]|nr:MAG: flagellar hook-associated protein 3 [Deltaproteobacteria bacterium]